MSKLKDQSIKARNAVTYHQAYMDVYTTGTDPEIMVTSPFILR